MSALPSRRSPVPERLATAERTFSAVADILKAMATADISSGEEVSGPALSWLADRMTEALDLLEPPPIRRPQP